MEQSEKIISMLNEILKRIDNIENTLKNYKKRNVREVERIPEEWDSIQKSFEGYYDAN